MPTQADLVNAASQVLTASGLAGQVTTTDTTAVLTLTATQQGPNGPEPVVITVTVGPMGGVVFGMATLQTSGTVLVQYPGNPTTTVGAQGAAYYMLKWWAQQSAPQVARAEPPALTEPRPNMGARRLRAGRTIPGNRLPPGDVVK